MIRQIVLTDLPSGIDDRAFLDRFGLISRSDYLYLTCDRCNPHATV